MTTDALLRIGQESLLLVMILAAGPALAAFAASVIVSALQTATQLQDITLTFVPKIAAALTAVILLGAWMMGELTDFTTALFAQLPSLAQAGG